jgi:hypothetical protein
MDARRREFLADHVDHAADCFDLSTQSGAMMAISSGVLRGPAARCTYVATVPCDENLTIEPTASYRVELDMFVDELAELDLHFEHLERDCTRAPALTGLWIDGAILAAWNALADTEDRLAILAGRCVFAGQVTANDRARMQRIVHAMTAIAGAPERRVSELAAALERYESRLAPSRLRIDGEGLVLVGWGNEIVVGVASSAGVETIGPQLRTYVRSGYGGRLRLVLVDATIERKHRPHWREPLVELEVGHRRWLTNEAVLPQPVLDVLEHARPTAIVATDDQITTSFAGWLADRARLGAALDFLRTLGSTTDGAPYR